MRYSQSEEFLALGRSHVHGLNGQIRLDGCRPVPCAVPGSSAKTALQAKHILLAAKRVSTSMECCHIEANVRDAARWEQPPPGRWSFLCTDALQSTQMQREEPIYLHCPFVSHLCRHLKTWTVDGEHVWIYYSENQFFHVAICKVRPDVHVCFEMTREDPHKKLSVRYAFSGEITLELRELKQNRISLGSVQAMLRWQLGLTEQQNIVSHEQPPVVFDTSEAESQPSETSTADNSETEPGLPNA